MIHVGEVKGVRGEIWRSSRSHSPAMSASAAARQPLDFKPPHRKMVVQGLNTKRDNAFIT